MERNQFTAASLAQVRAALQAEQEKLSEYIACACLLMLVIIERVVSTEYPLAVTAGGARVDAALLEASYKRAHEALESSFRDLYKWQGGSRVTLAIHSCHVATEFVCVRVRSAAEGEARTLPREGEGQNVVFPSTTVPVPQVRRYRWDNYRGCLLVLL